MIHKLWKQRSTGKNILWFVCQEYKVGSFQTNPSVARPTSIPDDARLIPYGRVRLIESNLGSSKLVLHYDKKSKFEYEFDDPRVTAQVMDYLLHNTPVKNYTEEPEPILVAIKKPLYALVGLGALLGVSYYTALQLESGAIVERQLIIVLLLAGVGSTWLLALLALLIAVVGFKVYTVFDDRTPILRLYYRRPSRPTSQASQGPADGRSIP